MSSPRHPSRLAEYVEGNLYYPRELAESDGNLYIINEDGSKTLLNPETVLANTTIKDDNGTLIGTVNPKTGGNITVPYASATKRGFVLLSDSVAKAPASTASAGTSTSVSRADHVHPVQTTISGNAGTATKLKTAVNITLSGVTATKQSFDGSSDITIPITAVPVSIVSGLSTVATSGKYSDLSGKPSIPSAATNTPKALGIAAIGTSSAYAREDHVHAAPTSVTGNAGTADKLKTAVNIGLSGVTATAQSFDGSSDVTIPITAVPASIVTGLSTVATSGKYSDLTGKPTIPSAATIDPKALGDAAVGTSSDYARADHVHAAPTSVTGNAGTADKLKTARTIAINGAVTGTATSFDGSENITINTTSVDASKISGTIPLDNLPKAALERLVPVTNEDARLALTIDDVQNGDVVKENDTGLMFFVSDDTKLGTTSSADAFTAFTAGTAAAVAWSGITGKPNFATVATSGKYSDLSGTPTIPSAATSTPKALGTAAIGTSSAYAREDHVHAAPTSVSGNAGTATKLKTAVNIGLSGVTATAQSFDGSESITIPITAVPASIVSGLSAVATSGKYSDLSGKPSIPSAATSSDTPKALGEATVGTSSAYARADHVHAAPTSVTGNAGTADKLKTAVNIGLSGVTATAQSFDGSSDITIPITAVPASIVSGLSAVATSGKYSDLTGKPSIPSAATIAPKALGTAAIGTSSAYAREDHVHAAPTSVTGNAGTATKLKTAVKIGLSGVTATEQSFDGSESITIPITAVPASIVNGLTPSKALISNAKGEVIASSVTSTELGYLSGVTSNVQTQLDGKAASNHGTHVSYGNSATTVGTESSAGTASTVSRSDHVHALPTNIAASKINGLTASRALVSNSSGVVEASKVTSTELGYLSGVTSSIQNQLNGKAASSHGTHVSYGDSAPSAPASTASAGTATTVSRSDHVHPLQTTVSGNAGTATQFASNQTVELTGDVTGSASSKAGWSIAATLATSGVSEGSYGPSANASPSFGGTFTVPYFTVDAKGRVTAASNKTITVPSHSHPSISSGSNSSASQTLSYGSTFSALSAITRDSNQHVTAYTTNTYTLPKPSVTYTASVGTTWTGSEAPFTQNITVSGMTANDNPIVDVVLDDAFETAQTQLADYGKIYRITTAANSITVYASEKTEAAVNIQLKCVK